MCYVYESPQKDRIAAMGVCVCVLYGQKVDIKDCKTGRVTGLECFLMRDSCLMDAQ